MSATDHFFAMPTHVIGKDIPRVDGRAKVTGRAHYAADNVFAGIVHAYGVMSTVADGRVAEIEAAPVLALPGVLGVWHHENFPQLHRSPNEMKSGTRVGEVRPPFEDDRVYYAGQFVAVVVAETFEQARAAARRLRIRYAEAKMDAPVTLGAGEDARGAHAPEGHEDERHGDADNAFTAAAVQVDATYTTPVEVHNPMELHATVARWSGGKLEVHDSTQWVVGQRKSLAAVLGIDAEDITVHAPFVGGGFGGKLFLWPHTVIAAALARETGRPLKLVLERRHTFTTVGHRPETRQRLRLGATTDGRLVSLRHDTWSQTSLVHEFVESAGSTSIAIYGPPDATVTHRVVRSNVGTPTPMRAPGAASGTFALECAVDELAIALKQDPVELRRRITSFDRDRKKNLPWSSCRLAECLNIASRKFGWERRDAEPGSMREGGEILGWGMATATWPAETGEAHVRVQLRDDGTARVCCATQDIGTGTYSVMAVTAAEVLGLPVEKISVVIGDSSLPTGPISGGSMVTATVVPVVAQAARAAIGSLLQTATASGAPFAGQNPDAVAWDAGILRASDRAAGGGDSARGVAFADVLRSQRRAGVDGEAKSGDNAAEKTYSFRAFGAHFVEVRWDPALARLRVARVVSAFDTGRIIHRKGALNQIEGAIMMGVGMALLEESVYDRRWGRVVTDNLADYLVPVNADQPEMDITLLDEPDPHIGEFGAKGMGEIGITGITAAIVNAIHHATGRRVRDLPVTVEKLL